MNEYIYHDMKKKSQLEQGMNILIKIIIYKNI